MLRKVLLYETGKNSMKCVKKMDQIEGTNARHLWS